MLATAMLLRTYRDPAPLDQGGSKSIGDKISCVLLGLKVEFLSGDWPIVSATPPPKSAQAREPIGQTRIDLTLVCRCPLVSSRSYFPGRYTAFPPGRTLARIRLHD